MFDLIATAAAGTLVIVGGALDPGNSAVFAAFIGALPKDAQIAVIPAASGTPTTSANAFAKDLARHGIARDRVVTVHLATEDDSTTPDNEAKWRTNATDATEIAKIAGAGGIWFTGGDQSRITATLLARGGTDTPMLRAIRARLAAGAVVGGSSAGAAIMSAQMISQGDSLAALLPAPAGEPMKLGRGLGFLPVGIVDQHFDARARLGRLTVALATLPASQRLGWGIDEDSALVVDLAANTARAVGSGTVTLIDARRATYRAGKRFSVEQVGLGIASGGDRVALADQSVTPASYKKPTIGREYHNRAALDGGGMAVPGATTAAVIGEDLLDNRATMRIDRLSFSGKRGVVFRFAETPASRGWWGRDSDGRARYAVEGVSFSILPVDVAVTEAAR